MQFKLVSENDAQGDHTPMDGNNSWITTHLRTTGYLVESYDQSTGIYYENKGQLNLYNTEWQVVVYISLKLC